MRSSFPSDSMLKKNTITEAEITGFTSDGGGVCRVEGRAVFVPRTLPGERWRVRIVKANRTAVWGRGEELLVPSPQRCEPECPVFGRCGGCSCLHMTYECELQYKLGRVNDALRRIGGLELQAEKIHGSENIRAYRNKAIYNFAPGPVCGFYRSRSHDVISAGSCLLQPTQFDQSADAVCAWMRKYHIPAYDEQTQKGVVRHLFLRKTDGGFAACLVAAKAETKGLAETLRKACPELTGILLCINAEPVNTVLTDDIRVLWGEPDVKASLCGAEFLLSTNTFFQVNSAQAEKLYLIAGSFADFGGKTVLDLYCGAGTIGQSVARDAARIIGNDIVPSAVENACRNAQRNHIENAEYICGDAAAVAAQLAERGLRPDIIITDPPRKGMDAACIDAIVTMAPPELIYISCDPATLARDLKLLTARGYTAEHCEAVDMFPRTGHVETCVLLVRECAHDDEMVSIKVDMDGISLKQGEYKPDEKPTYGNIKKWVKEKYGFNVTSLYIGQIKDKVGIKERKNYNIGSGDGKVPNCPPEKEEAIMEAFRHFGLI